MDATEAIDRLAAAIAPRRAILTAFSGGVDSTVVAAVACLTLGRDRAPAAVGDSASLPRRELQEVRELARLLDLELIEVEPGEQADPQYQANAADRCFFCKTHLYQALQPIAKARSIAYIANGTNLDDLGDHRPGLIAADDAGVISPLIDAGLDKAAVRAIAHKLGLPNADKPAAACLASRLPYGTPVTRERLEQVEAAENALRDLGLAGFRVRHHEQVARLELSPTDMQKIFDTPALRTQITEAVKAAGFPYVALDLEGFRSGSGNVTLGWEAASPASQTRV